MANPGEDVDGTTDVRGRTVVWSAGTPTRVPRRRSGAAWRWLGLVLLAAVSSFTLAYAVHTYVVLAPPPAGPAAPLWLPDRLPADDVADHVPSARPSSTRTAPTGDDGVHDGGAAARTARPRAVGGDDGRRATSVTPGHRSSGGSTAGSRSARSRSGQGSGGTSGGSGGHHGSGGGSDDPGSSPSADDHGRGGSSGTGSSESTRGSGSGGGSHHGSDDEGSGRSGASDDSGSGHRGSGGHGGSDDGADEGGSHGSHRSPEGS